ncbi:MAG: hypothetical protein NXI02_33065 [Rhodobacteraceae bacterium]|nr:hypothetical protein [Paracoccaceae bacterium]
MTRRQILESLHRGTVSLSDAREGILRQATNGEGTGRSSVETPKINKPTEAAAL